MFFKRENIIMKIGVIKLDVASQAEKAYEIATVYKEVFNGEPWNEVWDIDQVISDFKKEMLKIGSVCYVAQHQGKIVGFAWGYEIFVNMEIDKYLESPGLADIIGQGKYLYLDEVAVLADFRGKGIGKNLVISFCKGDNSQPILLRTKGKSTAFRMFMSLGGRVVLNISRERVIMIIEPNG
jgi:GNAT superfamily N-acetyltransferase